MKRTVVFIIVLIVLILSVKVYADLTGTEGLAIDLSSAGAGTDFTIAFDATELDAVTWSDGANASNIWTFDVSGTDHTMTAGNGLMTFSHAATVSGTLTASGVVVLGDGGDNFSIASDGIDIDTSGNITNAGTIASGVLTVTGVINTSVGLDAVGAVDMDYGSADVTDHTFTTNDCTIILDGGLTVSTGDTITLGATAWNSSDNINGEVIADDTIDEDSIDFADITGVDFTLTDCGAITSTGTITAAVGFDITGAADMDYGSADVTDHTFLSDGTGTGEFVLKAGAIDGTEILDDTIDSDDYAAGSIDYEHLSSDVITGAAARTAFESGDTFLIMEAGVGLREVDYDDLPGAGGGMTNFIAEDGDTTEVSISNAEEWKFVEGTGIDIDWTDTSTGSDADPFDLTFTVALGTDIAAAEMADADHGDGSWSGGALTIEAMTMSDSATSTYYVGHWDTDGAGAGAIPYTDTEFTYTEATGTLAATVFSGSGASLTNLDGEQLDNDSVDADSLDWGVFTDLADGGAVSWGNVTAGELAC
jgi:hypothetical protein